MARIHFKNITAENSKWMEEKVGKEEEDAQSIDGLQEVKWDIDEVGTIE